MTDMIVLFILLVLNVFASLFNNGLCVYYSTGGNVFDLLNKTAFMFSAFVIVCDILFCTYIMLLK